MFWFQLVVVLLLLAAVGWLAVGGGGHMSEPVPDRADLALPGGRQVAARDLDQVRFSVGLRGYRMEEVDDVLDRLAREVDARDRRIAELEGRSEASPLAGDGDEYADGDAGSGPYDYSAEYAAGNSAADGEGPGFAPSAETSAETSPARSAAASAASPETAPAEPGSGSDLPPLP
ncbi:MAG TPA: DivIVA domain-containing protein [Actinocrinis sp.]|nr:DivIVA domain-containing protein [Actinocrinis sp.]